MSSSTPQALSGGPASHEVEPEHPWDGPSRSAVSPQRAREVLELAVQAAQLNLASGDSAASTATTAERVATAYGVPVIVETSYNRIVMSHDPGDGQQPTTVIRIAASGQLDYDRLARLEKLVDAIGREGLQVELVRQRLDHIRDQVQRYRRWTRYLAAVLLGGGIAGLLGGGLVDVVVCMLATLLVELVRTSLSTRGMGNFFSQAIAAMPPTALGLLLAWVNPLLPETWRPTPSLVVAAGMVSLLAGIGVVMAAADAVDGYYVTASGRTMEVVVLTGAIVLGLLCTLWLGLALGVPGHIAPSVGTENSVVLRLAAGGLVAACLAVSCNLHPHGLPAAAGLGVLAQGTFLAANQGVSSPIGATAIAAVVIGLVARLWHRRIGMPMVAITTTAVGSLMPGLLLYRGVYAMVSGDRVTGASASTLLADCALTAVALAAGSSFGVSVGSMLLRTLREGAVRALGLDEPPPSTSGGHPLFGRA